MKLFLISDIVNNLIYHFVNMSEGNCIYANVL
nr:MAG TPA: hypothetical protein [Crassvirales sp.]DAH00324.1 MAG TPA: hypothetical protein [Crassvirales sp.]